MYWSHEREKQLILEGLGTPRFRDVFMWEVSKGRPLLWDGYKIARFFNPHVKDFDGMEFLAAELNRLARTLRFPRNPIHEAAIYFWLWRRCFKSGDMACYPESPADEPIRPAIDNDYSDKNTWFGQWTLFYLMFLDSLTWCFPKAFKLDPFEKNTEVVPRKKYVFGEVCRQLCGVRTSAARVFHDRTGTEDDYRQICSHCTRKHWAERFYKAEKHPALVLALSFYANGFASFKTDSNYKSNADSINANYLYDLVDHATNYRVFMPEDDWEARTVFFILAQWLFLSDRRVAEPTLEEHIFAILYLRFYRQGAGEYFKRDSISAIWDGIPYEKKEDVAAHYRRLLAGTRNKAAAAWPDARISDYPEIAEDGIAIGMLFQELVREERPEKLDILIGERSDLLEPYWTRELLWAASHSKNMYSYLSEHMPPSVRPTAGRVMDVDYDMIIDGWSKMPVEDLQWSSDAVKKLLHPNTYKSVTSYASLSMFSDVIPNNQSVQIPRLKTYVETLRLDPNAGDNEEYAYNTSHPILYRLVEHHYYRGANKAISYLLTHGANPNCGGHSCTCLGLAVAGNRLPLVKMLIEAGADVNLPSTTDRSPVRIAIDHNRAKALQMLIEAGAQMITIEDSYFNGERGAFWLRQNKRIRHFLGINGCRMIKEAGVEWPLFKRS